MACCLNFVHDNFVDVKSKIVPHDPAFYDPT